MAENQQPPKPPKIRFNEPSTLGTPSYSSPGPDSEPGIEFDPEIPGGDSDSPPIETEPSVDHAGVGSKKIRAIGQKAMRHEAQWNRTPNATGKGAMHVRTFHCKLTEDSLAYMDQQVNEWLDSHPQYEVKIVTSTIGVFTGKIKEPHVVCQVWV